MEAEQIYEVVETLIGPVEPYADTAIDFKRKENMEKLIYVFDQMHRVIDDIGYRYADSPYGSAKEIGQMAAKHIVSMGIENWSIMEDQYAYINNENFVKDAQKHTSCHHELAHGEIYVGNTSGNVRWEKGVDIPTRFAPLKTIRLGEQAYDINGKPLSRDYCRPLIIHKSEHEAHNRIMTEEFNKIKRQ